MVDVWLPGFLDGEPLGSSVLWSCLAHQLPWGAGQVDFVVEFDGAWKNEPAQVLRLRWKSEVSYPAPYGVPEKTVTELAACAIAIIVCGIFLQATVERLATDGDRFDYWVWCDGSWFGLEVSGSRQEEVIDLRQRHRVKVDQLLENPYRVDGFVVVTSFTARRILFSSQLLD